MFGQRAVRPFQ
jgi:fatty acid desaturase